jgi:hypothetical protein
MVLRFSSGERPASPENLWLNISAQIVLHVRTHLDEVVAEIRPSHLINSSGSSLRK